MKFALACHGLGKPGAGPVTSVVARNYIGLDAGTHCEQVLDGHCFVAIGNHGRGNVGQELYHTIVNTELAIVNEHPYG